MLVLLIFDNPKNITILVIKMNMNEATKTVDLELDAQIRALREVCVKEDNYGLIDLCDEALVDSATWYECARKRCAKIISARDK